MLGSYSYALAKRLILLIVLLLTVKQIGISCTVVMSRTGSLEPKREADHHN